MAEELVVELAQPFPEACVRELEGTLVHLSPHIRSAKCTADPPSVVLCLGGPPESDLKRRVERLASRMAESCRRVEKKLIDSFQGSGVFNRNPLPELLDRGWVRSHSPGAYSYSGPFFGVIEWLDSTLLNVALQFQAQPFEFPSTLPLDAALDAGYLLNHPHQAVPSAKLARSPETFQALSRQLRLGNHHAVPEILAQAAAVDGLQAPAVCLNFWRSLKGKRKLPKNLLVGTAAGICQRNEDELEGLERLGQFRMREIFVIGEPGQVAGFSKRLSRLPAKLARRWGLTGFVETATDSFYLDRQAVMRIYQLNLGLKQELRLQLPFEEGRTLAAASLNFHRDYFAQAFAIGADMPFRCHSCCLAFGLERLAFSLFAQHGMEVDRWPFRVSLPHGLSFS
ncbi:MAG TPA: hypothetical protein VLU25_15620 [Acidobacteriota bacterium]|nr:hypothetical protein [Acidobacteriota bacterium]